MMQFILAVAELFLWLAEVSSLFFGPIGSWFVWLVTFGKCDIDNEGWTAHIIGWCVVAFGIFCWVMYWQLYA